MSTHAYSEDHLVDLPAIGLFAMTNDWALIERYNAGSNQKCLAVFEHVYESYPERNAGVYAMAV